MGKWIKRVLATVGILLLLLIIAAVAVPFLFKDRIEQAVKDQVNANLKATVEWGEWDISVISTFPNAGISVENVKVCNVAPFEGVCLADIGKLEARMGLMSLFGDQVLVHSVFLDHPKLTFKVLADGSANWDIAKPDSAATPAPAGEAAKFNVKLKRWEVVKGHIVYDDATLPMVLDLAGVDHTGSGDFTQDLFVMSTQTYADSASVVYDDIAYLKNAKADVKADLDMDMPNMKFTFKENEATVNKLVLGFDGWLAMPTDDIVMDLKWDTKKADFVTLLSLVPAEFASDLEGVDVTGKATFNGYVKGTYNDKQMPGFGVTIDVDNGRFKYPDLPASCENIFVDCKITSPEGADMDGMVVDLKRFALSMAGNPVSARIYLTTPMSDPNVDAELKARLDLASVKKVVPMGKDDLQGQLDADVTMAGRMSDVDAGRYDKFKASGSLNLKNMVYKSDSLPYAVGITDLLFKFSPQFLELANYTGTIGGSDLQAKGRIDNYLEWWLKDSTIAGTFNVNSSKFDLNELMPASAEAPAGNGPGVDTVPMTLIEVPKNVDFHLTANVKQVIYDNMTLDNCRGFLHVHDERVDLSDVFFNLFGGGVEMDGGYSTQDKAHPRIDLHYDVKDLDIEQTVKYAETVQKMAPIAKSCKGRFSTDLQMSAELDQHMMPVMNTLEGKGHLRTKSVSVTAFQPLVDLSRALKLTKLENTTLQNVAFTYKFKDGKMITDKFPVKIDRIKAEVEGSTAFADQTIDYDMTAKVPSDMFGAQATQFVSGLLGQANQAIGSNFTVPAELDLKVKMTGTIEKPIVKPVFAGGQTNLGQVVEEEIKQELNEQIDKAKEEAIARAREEAARLLAEAQKQADALKAQARRQAADVKAQAYKAADDLVNGAKDPISKAAARIAADKAKKEADKKEQQFIAEADRKADALVEAARKKGDELIAKAEATNTTIK